MGDEEKGYKFELQIHELTSKTEYKHKWFLVYASFFLQFGSLYAYQDFSTNHDYYKQHFSQQVSGAQFEFYYNIIYSMSLFFLIYFAMKAGVLCDYYGASVIIVLQWAFMTVGAGVVLGSVYFQQFLVLFVGRSLVFMANSTMFISTGTFVQQYFEQREQSTAQSIMNTSILALFVNLNLATYLYERFGLAFTAEVVFGICVLCFGLAVVVYNIDRKLEIEINGEEQEENESQNDSQNQEFNNGIKRQGTSKDISISKFYEQMKNYPTAFIYFMCSVFLTLTVSTIVEIVGPAFLTSYYKMTPVKAGQICSLAPLTSIFLIFFGKIVDKFQSHTILNILQCFLHALALFLLPNVSYSSICFLLYGLGYCLRMMLSFPIQAIFVPKVSTGTVYAFTRASKDFIGFFITLINGWIAQNYGYEPVIYISGVISVIGMIFAILLHNDYKKMINNNDLYFLKLQEINYENDQIKRKKTNQDDTRSYSKYQQFIDENSFVAVGMTNLKCNRDQSNISKIETDD